MLFAKVVFGLPVEGPFDYIVPPAYAQKIKAGSRVWVSFGPKKQLGYVIGLTRHTSIKKLKPILELIDEFPILNDSMLSLTKALSEYYCCSWGEMIETAIPDSLRRGRKTLGTASFRKVPKSSDGDSPSELVYDLGGRERWPVYLAEIKKTLDAAHSALVLFPDIESVVKARQKIKDALSIDPSLLYRKQPQELEAWCAVRESKKSVVVGTRSSVFAPLEDLGLIIIDEEEQSVYKQDQVPHYHAREAAFLRAKLENAKLVLGSVSPSLESFFLARNNTFLYTPLPRKESFPQAQAVDLKHVSFADRKRKNVFTRALEDAIFSVINEKGKTLLFINRKGFATAAACHNCGAVLKCERCNINLVYHFEGDTLKCHYCNFKMAPPKICPQCNAGYIKFSGTGTEKIESELHRQFPQARIKRLDEGSPVRLDDADIFIATSAIFKETDLRFDLIGVLAIDNTLNRVDFRASEKAFGLLAGLLSLTGKRIIIQTHFPGHHCFQWLAQQDARLFYDKELEHRKQLGFPPYKHLVLVKLRGKSEQKVEDISRALYEKLAARNKGKKIQVLSVAPGQPSKLRGNFYRQVLLSATDPLVLNKFLKLHLKDFLHSGIIVTVDVDPV